MGYTHYWYQSSELDKDKFNEAMTDCEKVCSELCKGNLELKGWDGTGEAVFDDIVSFNGNSEKDQDHETFSVQLEKGTSYSKDDAGRDFYFCKTARKPYDIAVQCCLIVFNHHLGTEHFVVTSDGDMEEWQDAMTTCQDVLGYGDDFKLGE